MAEKETELLCIGNALVDIFASGVHAQGVPAQSMRDLCERYGISGPVQHVEIERLKELVSLLPEYSAVSGGGAANVAKIAALLGTRVSFTGALGREKNGQARDLAKDQTEFQSDEFGRLFSKELSDAGVMLHLHLKSPPTGLCLYIKTGDETRIAASPSAALELCESDIPEDELKKARLVVIDGFMLNRQGLVRRILSLAEKYGTIAAMDLGSAAIAGEQAAEIADYARHDTILFMNEAEAIAFYKGIVKKEAGSRDEETVLANACAYFKSMTEGKSFPIIVVKLGKRGALVFAGGIVYRAETREHKPLESTGAGDAFSAAFLSAWVRNKPLAECAALGNRAGRIVLDVAGTQVNREQLKDIAAVLLGKD